MKWQPFQGSNSWELNTGALEIRVFNYHGG